MKSAKSTCSPRHRIVRDAPCSVGIGRGGTHSPSHGTGDGALHAAAARAPAACRPASTTGSSLSSLACKRHGVSAEARCLGGGIHGRQSSSGVHPRGPSYDGAGVGGPDGTELTTDTMQTEPLAAEPLPEPDIGVSEVGVLEVGGGVPEVVQELAVGVPRSECDKGSSSGARNAMANARVEC